jgi:glycine/D-amino acid oxidase-like deaminating enzyme
MPTDNLAIPPLLPVHAELDRLTRITVCTRPFRAQGPRIEAERLGDKLIVHNYGHGGSGWSLSWGAGTVALDLALAGRDPSTTDLAVVGCGAMGLTAAILAQQTGVRSVTIYAKDDPTHSRSFVATGSWTPFSRVALRDSISASFPAQWDEMTRTSWQYYQRFMAQTIAPAALMDRYYLFSQPPDEAEQKKIDDDPIGFVSFRHRLPEIAPATADFAPGTHPFAAPWVRRRSEIMFNITAMVQQLTEEFHCNGGQIVMRQFHAPSDFTELPQPVILNCTGFGAHAIFGDRSLTPIRGQIGWLPAQPEVDYGFYSGNLTMLSRPDGIVVQLNPQAEASGWNDATEAVDRAEAEEGIRQLQAIYAGMKAWMPPNNLR